MKGLSAPSVSKKTTLLVAGPGSGGKSDQAAKLGVPIMDSAEFAELVTAHRRGDEDTVAALLSKAF